MLVATMFDIYVTVPMASMVERKVDLPTSEEEANSTDEIFLSMCRLCHQSIIFKAFVNIKSLEDS
jgi:hypothetical protein